jgi:hypothetical protein
MLTELLALASRRPGITVAEAAHVLHARPEEVRTAALLLRRLGRLSDQCGVTASSCGACALAAACPPAGLPHG